MLGGSGSNFVEPLRESRSGHVLNHGRVFGRNDFIGDISTKIADRTIRMASLVGSAGIGKTTIAQALLRQPAIADAFETHFIDMTTIEDVETAKELIARSLAPGGFVPFEKLRSTVSSAPRLVVLDNVEQIDGIEEISFNLEEQLPGIALVLTSRRSPHDARMFAIEVPPLPFPDRQANRDDVLSSPAIRLAAFHAFSLISVESLPDESTRLLAQLCRRSGGVPLVLILHARSSRLYGLEAVSSGHLAQSLVRDHHDSFGYRHDSMEAALDDSFRLLSDDAEQLLLRVSIFRGGICLDHLTQMHQGFAYPFSYPCGSTEYGVPWSPGQEVHDEGPIDSDGLWPRVALPRLNGNLTDLLAELSALHLVTTENAVGSVARFSIPGAVREFSASKINKLGLTESVQHAHATLMVKLCEAGGFFCWTHLRPTWEPRLTTELPNIRAAFNWLIAQPKPSNQLLLRATSALWSYWQTTTRMREGIHWLNKAIARPGGSLSTRASAQIVLGGFLWNAGDNASARSLLLEALEIATRLSNPSSGGRAELFLSYIAWSEGKPEADILNHLNLSTELFQRAEDIVGLGFCHLGFGIAERKQGNPARAEECFGKASRAFEAIGFAWGVATAQLFLGELHRSQGRMISCASALLRAVHGYADLNDRWGMGGALAGLAGVAFAGENLQLATRLATVASTYLDQAGATLSPNELRSFQTLQTLLHAITVRSAGAPSRFDQAGLGKDDALRLAGAAGALGAVAQGASWRAVLSEEQHTIIQLIERGLEPQEIAFRLGQSRSKIYALLKSACQKLGESTNGRSINDRNIASEALRRLWLLD